MRSNWMPAGWRQDLDLFAVSEAGPLKKVDAIGFRWEVESNRWVDINITRDAERCAVVHFTLWYGDRSEAWEVPEYLMLAICPLGGAVSLEYLRRGMYSSSLKNGELDVRRQTQEEAKMYASLPAWSENDRTLSLVDSLQECTTTVDRRFRIRVWDDHGVDLKFCEGRGGEAAVLVSLHKKLTCQIGDKYRTLRLVPAFGGYGCATMGFEECTAVFSRDDVPFRV